MAIDFRLTARQRELLEKARQRRIRAAGILIVQGENSGVTGGELACEQRQMCSPQFELRIRIWVSSTARTARKTVGAPETEVANVRQR